MLKIIENWLKDNGYYKFSELQVGGHCGLCGNWVDNEILPKDWNVTICKICLEKDCETDSQGNVYRKSECL
jgi:hypothetical protein